MSLEIEMSGEFYLSDNGASITVRRKEYTDMLAQARAINKMLSEGVEVSGWDGECWNQDDQISDKYTHKALLINITEIKVQTREEKLEAVLRDFVRSQDYSDQSGLRDRAKKALEAES